MNKHMARPDVSVVVVNYDGKEHLGPFFDSVFAQTLPREAYEVIFVDNGSSDGSVEFVRAHYPTVRILENDRNLGFARPNNQAAELARGRFLALLNNDMRAEPEWLERMVTYLDSAPTDVVCAASRILNWDGSRVDFVGGALAFNAMGYQLHFGEPAAAVGPEDWPKELLFACGGAMMIDRQVFLDVGCFDEAYFAYFEDVDLGWRLWVLGYRVGFCGEAVTYHRHNGTSAGFGLPKKMVLIERNALYTLIKNYDDVHLNALLPVALLLAVKRLAVRSGVDREEFAFTRPEGRLPRPLRQLRDSLREGGPKGLVKLLLIKLATRILARFSSGAPVAVKPEAYSTVVAIEDLLDQLPAVLAKRHEIQTRRRRSDREILSLFRIPFNPIDPTPSYVRAHETVVESLALRRLFQSSPLAAGVEVER